MGLLEKHKVKVTLPPPPSLHSHLAWRQWDACATNHLYTLISASGPQCCLLLSEQMTFRKRSELGGRDEEMGRWGGGRGEGDVWQFAGVRGRLWELDLKLGGKLCVPYVNLCKGGFHCAPILYVFVCVFSVSEWSIWVVYWITFTIVCIPHYYHWKSCSPPLQHGNRKCGAHIVSS